MKFFTACSIVGLLILYPGCITHIESNNSSVKIEYPLNKKAVYAVCDYQDYSDSIAVQNIEISSILFDSTYSSGDTVYLTGIFSRDRESNSAPISAAVINNWILFEHSGIQEAGMIFLKPAVTDTTALPDQFHNHFPIVPQKLKINSNYSITRPANEGSEWGYAEVIRIFESNEFKKWTDFYNDDYGIKVNITHYLLGFSHNFQTVFDAHGLVNSQWSYKNYITNEHGDLIDSVLTHRINRRIVDYTGPGEVDDLQTYYNLVSENGLKIIN